MSIAMFHALFSCDESNYPSYWLQNHSTYKQRAFLLYVPKGDDLGDVFECNFYNSMDNCKDLHDQQTEDDWLSATAIHKFITTMEFYI